MNRIQTTELKEGMVFDEPVYIDGESVFIAAGVPVKSAEIDRLKKWGIAEVQTEGRAVRIVAPEPATPAAHPTGARGFLLGAEKRYVRAYTDAADALDAVFEDVSANRPVLHDRIDGIAQKLIDCVKEARNEMVQVVVFTDHAKRRLASSSVNTAVLAMVIGMQLKLTMHNLHQLTVGALLHDVGMLSVPTEIVEKEGKLTPDEVAEIRKHPLHSYRIIDKVLKYPQDVAEVGLHHQERWDGKGYPRHLRGEDIAFHARIVTVAQSYAAMVKERPYRSSMIGYHAMKSILSDNGRQFDPRVLKAFLVSIGVFPLGSIVQLNNSAIGRVVSTNADAPLRPKVELVVDESGVSLDEPALVDLAERKTSFIVRAIDPRTLQTGGGG